MSQLVPLDNLIADLRAATEGGKSGAFFITTEDQHSAMITLDNGTITGLTYRTARGYDAARALAGSSRVRYQSAAEPTDLTGEGALEAATVLATLAGREPMAGSGESGQRDDGPASRIDLDALRARYIAAIGPIAGALFDEAVEDMGDALDSREGVDELVRRLAAQIDDDDEAERFLRDARAQR